MLSEERNDVMDFPKPSGMMHLISHHPGPRRLEDAKAGPHWGSRQSSAKHVSISSTRFPLQVGAEKTSAHVLSMGNDATAIRDRPSRAEEWRSTVSELLPEHAVVVLTRDLPDEAPRAGDVAVVLLAHPGRDALTARLHH